MAEVFISYSRKDRSSVQAIIARFEELDVGTWLDVELSPGQVFRKVINTELRGAKAVLVCWSPNSSKSDEVNAEAEWAYKRDKYVPIIIAPCELMPPFSSVQTTDLSQWNHAPEDPNWLMVVENIAKRIGREGVAAAAHAYASGNEAALLDVANRYPKETAVRRLVDEARYRQLFSDQTTRLLEMLTTSLEFRLLFLQTQVDLDQLYECIR